LSIRFQADNDLKRIIVDATLRREPRIDFQTAQAARLDDLDDEAVLRLAGSQSRILVSHDKRTMPKALASFLASGSTSPGVLLVIPQNAAIPEGTGDPLITNRLTALLPSRTVETESPKLNGIGVPPSIGVTLSETQRDARLPRVSTIPAAVK
jgi:hypothetical protein